MKCKTIAGSGTLDILEAMKGGSLPLFLALSDIRQRYRRSTLGPFWISISMGVMIGCIGLIFGGLFRSPMQDFTFSFLWLNYLELNLYGVSRSDYLLL
jgi:ABC-type polysaccharide/polyol phosphate export permease